jgi:hypothetical protein
MCAIHTSQAEDSEDEEEEDIDATLIEKLLFYISHQMIVFYA